MEYDDYSSHLAVFEKIFSQFDIKNVLEFGMGRYSTAFFAERCKLVISIEQQSEEWFEKMKAEINCPHWFSVFQQNPAAVFKYFDGKGTKFDLVFSDGLAQTRCMVANMAMAGNVPLVVLHDAEKIWYYRWNLLDIPDNYARFDFRCRKGSGKVTTILTNSRPASLEQWNITEHDRIIQAYSSPCQQVIQIPYARDVNKPAHIT